MTPARQSLRGLELRPGYLDRADQEALLAAVREAIRQAPLYTPTMPRTGQPFSVRMTNCGSLGWVSDAAGYRYQRTHPTTERPWPDIPELALRAWRDLTPDAPAPEACLINVYAPTARMGLHQDRDEKDFSAPVLSLSLGDTFDRTAQSASILSGGPPGQPNSRVSSMEHGRLPDAAALGTPDP